MPEGTEHIGDARFGERRFVDTSPWRPPSYVPEQDAFFRPARTVADRTIEEAASEAAGVSVAGTEPGVSEFSYGRGLMVPVDLGPGPTQVEEAAAIRRTNPADPTASHLDRYADWIRE